MKHLLIAVLALAVGGCAKAHAIDRGRTALDVAEHRAMLEECFNTAVVQHWNGESITKINMDFEVCANAADKKLGVKP